MLLAADLSLTSSDADVSVEAGNPIVYTYDYANTGDMIATGVSISALVPRHTTFDDSANDAGWVCGETGNSRGTTRCTLDLGDVAAGSSDTVTFRVLVDDELSSRARKIYNFARISDDGQGDPDSSRRNNYAGESTPVLRQLPDLQLSVSGDDAVIPDGTITYSIDYSNGGLVEASGASITMRVPSHTTFSAANSDPAWICDDDGVCTLDVGDLAPGQTGSAAFAVTVDADVSTRVRLIFAHARIADDGTGAHDNNRWNNHAIERTSVIHMLPDVSLTIDDGGATALPGNPLVYSLTYTNQGTVDASGVTVSMRLPRHTTFDAAASSSGWTCDRRQCSLDVGSLAAGESVTVTFAVTVDPDLSLRVRNIHAFAKIRHDGPDNHRFNNFVHARIPVGTP